MRVEPGYIEVCTKDVCARSQVYGAVSNARDERCFYTLRFQGSEMEETQEGGGLGRGGEGGEATGEGELEGSIPCCTEKVELSL